eukprot:Hpha_TRINITY_DN16551_c1_g3::TRINITY_DN16551_c1_g3_i1::g.136240::m.136240/K05863/SLC25A4S, ANT; solute carrier family 25 (mitochondrial adenine nucleotide translocator), member 4/5/6/31
MADGKKLELDGLIVAWFSLSRTVSKSVWAPLETVKVVLQTQGVHQALQDEQSDGGALKFDGVADCIVYIYKTHGLRAFWTGNVASCLLEVISTFMDWEVKKVCKLLALPSSPDEPLGRWGYWWNFTVRNLIPASLTAFFAYPLSVSITRQRAEAPHRPYQNKFLSFGVGDIRVDRLYRGFPSCLLKLALFRTLGISVFRLVVPWTQEVTSAAQIAALLVQLVTYPIETVQRKLEMEVDRDPSDRKYTGALHCIKSVLREEGVRGLYAGIETQIVRTVASQSLQWVGGKVLWSSAAA